MYNIHFQQFCIANVIRKKISVYECEPDKNLLTRKDISYCKINIIRAFLVTLKSGWDNWKQLIE